MGDRRRFIVVKKTLLYEDLLAELEAAILDVKLKPGDRLNETELAEEFGVSRGPNREALQDLERRGIVIRIPNRSTFVREWSAKEVRDFYLFRAHVEALSVRLAAERRSDEDLLEIRRILDIMRSALDERDVHRFMDADTDFHLCVAPIANFMPLLSVIESLRWRTRLLMAWAKLTYGTPIGFEDAFDYHERITTAIADGDGNRAEQVMHDHIINSSQRMMEQWQPEGAASAPIPWPISGEFKGVAARRESTLAKRNLQ